MSFSIQPCGHRRRKFGTPPTPIRKFHGGVSARKLVAWLWRLRFVNNSSNGHRMKCGGSLFAPRVKLIEGVDKLCTGREYCVRKAHPACSSNFKCSLKNGFLLKFRSYATMEEATKRGLRRSRASNEKHCWYTIMKLLEDQVTAVSVASAAQAELARAQLQIRELQAERLIVKKNFERLQRKLGEERNFCQIRQYEKLQAVMVDLKNELKSERKNCRKMEIFNSKLVDELLKAKESLERLTEAYDKEMKARESVEEVCNELTNKITEDKLDFEVMKMETVRIQEQLEEERKMLQMAEVWREERVQMKLIDAKLALEDKYSELNKLVTELESFLRCKGSVLDVIDLRNGEMIRQAAKTVNPEKMEEFSYEPPKSSDIYSIFEEVRQMEAFKQVNGSLTDSTSESANTQLSELCSKSAGQIMQKHSSASKLCISSFRKTTSNESSEMRSSNTSSSVVTNLNRESHHVATPEQWSSSDIANPHVLRPTKARIIKQKTTQTKT